jgi:predicted phage terminase large subunit-like protein
VTGKGAHLAILDDPLKDREEAESKAVIRTLHSWYKSSFRTRINPEDGAIVIIQTRWSQVDAIGLALDLEEHAPEEYREGWHMIDFPATYEPWELRPRIPDCVTVEEDFRTVVGEPLCPERYDARALGVIKATLGSREWNCLYQQNPTALDAAIFRASWWKYRAMVQPDGSRIAWDRVILSVDCAFEDAGTSDFVCVAVLGQRQDGSFDVIDVINERLDVVKTMAVIREQTNKWNPTAILIERAANGHAVIQMMKKKLPNIIAIKPTDGGSKTTRAQGAAPLIEAGSVFVPVEAHWLAFVIDQFSTVPVGKNDDAVDAITQGLNWLRDRANPILSIATWGRSATSRSRRPTKGPHGVVIR